MRRYFNTIIDDYTEMLMPLTDEMQVLMNFLRKPTPRAWIEAAVKNIPLLLLDHAHCERKAAMTALQFMSKYPQHEQLIKLMSPLAREELLHFEKVLDHMQARGIAFGALPSCGYAQKLHALVDKNDYNLRLCDQLLIGAIIEARSCERFHALIPYLPDEQLQRFYHSLVKAEARHFENYIALAKQCGVAYEAKLNALLDLENKLISETCEEFRFHSGIPLV